MLPPDRPGEPEGRLASLLRSTSEGIWGLDLEGCCTFANPACLRLLGYASADELLGRNMHALTHHHRADGSPYAETDCRIFGAFRSGLSVDAEDELFFRRDGTSFWARYRSSPIFEGDIVAGAVVCFEDISARRQGEAERQSAVEALRLSESRHRAVLAALVEGIVVRDAEGRIRYANAAAEAILGLSFAELDGTRFPDERWRAFLPDGTPCPPEQFPAEAALRTGQAQRDVELVIARPGGQRTWMSMNAQPFTGLDGEKTIGVVTSFFDISERMAAEEERRKLWAQVDSERRRLAAVVDNIPLAVGIAEAPSGRIVVANPWVERILRHAAPPTADVAGYTQWACFHPDGRPFAPGDYPLARALQTGEVVQAEPIDYRFGDGTRGTIEVSAAPVRDAAGTITAAVVIYGDITERRRLELLSRRRAEFEQHLIGIVSHDLRNPLATIGMSVELLLGQGDLDDRTLRGLARIRRSADRATRMVRDLLDFTQARLGEGIRVSPRAMDLADAARQVVDELRLASPQREIVLRVDGDARGTWDEDRVAQVLTNLLSNAVAYSPPGTPVAVRVSGGERGGDISHDRRQPDGAGDEVVVEVHNSGPPIPEDRLPALFEPMKRGPGGPGASAGRSIGLGLYIVLQIVRAHGGSVAVSSTVEAGTRFVLRLPRTPPPR